MDAAVLSLMLAALVLSGCSAVSLLDNAALVRQVEETELLFAGTMARRDFIAFQSFLAEEAVFYTAPKPLRGKAAVVAFWKADFEGAQAPFSWRPDQVDVLPSGKLAHSSGPVFDHQGKVIGRFNTVWRKEGSGQWKIVFETGASVCQCDGAKSP